MSFVIPTVVNTFYKQRINETKTINFIAFAINSFGDKKNITMQSKVICFYCVLSG